MSSMLVAMVTRDGRMVELYTSQVDTLQAAKPLGAVLNIGHCEAIQRAMTPKHGAVPASGVRGQNTMG